MRTTYLDLRKKAKTLDDVLQAINDCSERDISVVGITVDLDVLKEEPTIEMQAIEGDEMIMLFGYPCDVILER